jgi:2-polyprenyl-3-methyl-5-hydroxy-6-metoxy-1,4-benzoquinol methylase
MLISNARAVKTKLRETQVKDETDRNKANRISSNSNDFDKSWRATFEELGMKDLPAYRKASYETGRYAFNQRDTFLHHLIKDLVDNMNYTSQNRQRRDRTKSPSCLDIGCNIGRYTQKLHQHDFNVCGMDYAAPLVVEAKRNWPDIPFFIGDAYDVPFKDNTFHCVVSFGLLQCVSDRRKVLQEMVRVLKPGGIGLVETIKYLRFPLIEKVIRHFILLITREMSFFELVGKLKAHGQGLSTDLVSYAPMRQGVADIVGLLMNLGTMEIKIHNTKNLLCLQKSFWGLSFRKKNEESISPGLTSTSYCPVCLSFGKWKVS